MATIFSLGNGSSPVKTRLGKVSHRFSGGEGEHPSSDSHNTDEGKLITTSFCLGVTETW
jgi:hypothetical protein